MAHMLYGIASMKTSCGTYLVVGTLAFTLSNLNMQIDSKFITIIIPCNANINY